MMASAHPTGDKVEIAELFRRWQEDGDRRAREELIHRHLPLARGLARRYARTPEPFEDLLQVASLGLVKAVDRFDAARGAAFTSFAVPTILGELKRHFRDKGRSIHLPRGLQELVLKVQEADEKLSRQSGRSPTVIEIAEHLRVETEAVLEALEAIAANQSVSLDAPVDIGMEDGASNRHELLGADDQGYAAVDISVSLASAFEKLAEGDRELLDLRFGQQLTQREIASRIGVSQMQVSRMLRRITEQLRGPMDMEPPDKASGQGVRTRDPSRRTSSGPAS
jgi:RNA polymerase sigma-B factor